MTATYVQENSDWTITVAGLGKKLTARAPGIIAARDRADQLVEKLAGEQSGRTVVHLLHGSALDFTAAYMQARLARPSVPATTPEPAAASKGTATSKKAAASRTNAKRKPAPATPPKRTRRAAAAKEDPAQPDGKRPDVNGVVGNEAQAAAKARPAKA